MSLFGELKRRNVFRAGIAYVVVAWLVLQVVDVILNNIDAPAWVFFVTLMLLGAGFIIVLVFSWVFEMTSEGVKRESEVDRSQSIVSNTGKKLDRLITGVLVLALAYFMIDKFVLSAGRDAALIEATLEQAVTTETPARDEIAAEPDHSIAVLPFVNMSDDVGNEYFSDGISEEILNALAKVRELKVAGRTSSFAFKGQNQDLRKIGETLGVQNILEGSVRKAGNTVRITAQLIKVDDGFHLWSETYDRELDDIFAIQDEIAAAILQEMKTTLLGDSTMLTPAARTEAEVYDLYLMARQRLYDRTELSLQSAADLLDRAIALDPEYAPAYAQRGIASMLLSVTSYGKIPQTQAFSQAKLYLDKALDLDPNLAEAWAGMGFYYNGPPEQPLKSIPALEKALAINPNLINAGNWLNLAYWRTNRVAESMALLDELTQRDPMYKPAFGNRVFLLAWMGKADQARAYVDRIEPFMSDKSQVEQSRAWIDLAEGKAATGLRRMQSAMEKQPTDRVYRVGVNQGHYLTQQFEQVFDDNWSDIYGRALLQLGRVEEARILVQKQAADGDVRPLFRFLNTTDQSDLLIEYFDERWPDLEAFQLHDPAPLWGYWPMADIALAYRRTGNQQRFEEALAVLRASNQSSYSQGIRHPALLMLMAIEHVLAGETTQALEQLAIAIDSGYINSAKISQDLPFFRELDGNPEYEAIQARMIEHINRERLQLGLGPT